MLYKSGLLLHIRNYITKEVLFHGKGEFWKFSFRKKLIKSSALEETEMGNVKENWGEDSVAKILALKSRGPEFRSLDCMPGQQDSCL